MSMSQIDRLDELQQYLANRRRVTLEEIHEQFQVSIATARRDLDLLAEQGVVQRTRGGAIVSEQAPPQLPIFNRNQDQMEEKSQIGRAAAALVKEGETIFLGGGTTALEVAKNITKIPNLSVITNSLLVINKLADLMNINLIILGGVFRTVEYVIYGHFAEHMLKEINADKVIFGARSISCDNGVTNDFTPDVSTDKAILDIGRELILVADHTKFNRVSTVDICPITRLNKIVTDKSITPAVVKSIESTGVEVIIAE